MNAKEQESLLHALKARFESNMPRHNSVVWSEVRTRLEGSAAALKSLREMEF